MLRLFPRRLPRPSPPWDHPRQRGAQLIYVRSFAGSRYASASLSTTQGEVKRSDDHPEHKVLPVASTQPKLVEPEKPSEPSTSHSVPSAEGASQPTVKDTLQQNSSEPIRSSSGPPPPAPNGTLDVDGFKGKMREWSENAIIAARERADRYTASAIKSFAQLGRELNKVTGYGEIESLKRRVTEQGTRPPPTL